MLRSDQSFLKFILIVISGFSFYLMVALISFNPADPSWLQTGWSNEPIHNFAGRIGAWIADMLLLIFGLVAYAIPVIMLFLCGMSYRQHCIFSKHIDCFFLSLRVIGFLIILLTSCSLTALNINDSYYFPSGGIIGILLSNIIITKVSSINAMLLLFCILLIGAILFFSDLWRIFIQQINYIILGFSAFITKCLFFKKKYIDNNLCSIDNRKSIIQKIFFR